MKSSDVIWRRDNLGERRRILATQMKKEKDADRFVNVTSG